MVLVVQVASCLEWLVAVVESWLLFVDKTCLLLAAVVADAEGAVQGCTPKIGGASSHWFLRPLHLVGRIDQHCPRLVTAWGCCNLFV